MKRKTLIVLLLILIPIGLGTKFYHGPFERWVHAYAGDIFYAMFWYFCLRLMWRRLSPWLCATFIFLFCSVVEFSQLVLTSWLEILRRTFFGAVLLGTGFDWPDLVYYALGVGFAVGIEYGIEAQRKRQKG